jgi:hypothetical protein
MSGIINGINYSLLFSSNSSTASIVGDMLNTLYSGSTSSFFSTASTGNSLLDLKVAQMDQTADVAEHNTKPPKGLTCRCYWWPSRSPQSGQVGYPQVCRSHERKSWMAGLRRP